MDVLQIVAQQLQQLRKEYLFTEIFDSFKFGFIIVIFSIVIIFSILKSSFNKKFSFFVKQKIFNLAISDLGDIRLINYCSKGENFISIMKKVFDFSEYIEEDVFLFRIKGVDVLASEVELINRSRKSSYNVFKGIVFRIPKSNFKLESNFGDTLNYHEEQDFVYIFKLSNQDLFEFELFKKIEETDLEKFVEDVKSNLSFVKNFIK